MGIKFVGKARLTKQGQLTLPNEARKDLRIDSESEVYWYQVDGYLIAVKELMNEKEIEKMLLKKKGR